MSLLSVGGFMEEEGPIKSAQKIREDLESLVHIVRRIEQNQIEMQVRITKLENNGKVLVKGKTKRKKRKLR